LRVRAEAGPVVELGDVMRGEHPGRTSEDEVAGFVSPPDLGFVDGATAWWCYQPARQLGVGVDVPLVSREPLDEAAAL
jgi:ornithine cyclodeaminase/alanine dehydrogenase-like protein (mu-crystallin family)